MRTYNVKNDILKSNLSQSETFLVDNGIRKYRNVLLLLPAHTFWIKYSSKKFFFHA